jgi:hypothetical protein
MEVQEVGPMATSLKQYKGPRYQPGDNCDIPVGAVVLRMNTASFKHNALCVISILMPDGTWHDAIDCTPPQCGQQLRDRTRTWLATTAESRVIRAMAEQIERYNVEIDNYLEEDDNHTLDDSFVFGRLRLIDTVSDIAVTATGNKLITEESIFTEFERWLEALAARSDLEPETIYNMLIRGARRSTVPHVTYLQRFNRTIRFQDNINE